MVLFKAYFFLYNYFEHYTVKNFFIIHSSFLVNLISIKLTFKTKNMNPILKNILAVVVGFVVGSVVNMSIITIFGYIITPPDGADVTTTEGLKASLHLFEPKHFVSPFLAHALGTLVGAFVAAKIAANHKMKFALGIGFLFLIAGIVNVYVLPAPMWFNALDVIVAYIPMGYIGGKLALKKA